MAAFWPPKLGGQREARRTRLAASAWPVCEQGIQSGRGKPAFVEASPCPFRAMIENAHVVLLLQRRIRAFDEGVDFGQIFNQRIGTLKSSSLFLCCGFVVVGRRALQFSAGSAGINWLASFILRERGLPQRLGKALALQIQFAPLRRWLATIRRLQFQHEFMRLAVLQPLKGPSHRPQLRRNDLRATQSARWRRPWPGIPLRREIRGISVIRAAAGKTRR